MTTSSPLSTRELSDRVRALEPLIREHGPKAERDRRLPDEVSRAMRDTGLYRLWRPKALGGNEVDPVSAFRVFEEVARMDSAAAWNLLISSAFESFGAWFADDAAEEIFGRPDAILAGSFNPARRAVPTRGGYRLSGRTPFVSGAHQATWFFGLANIYDDDGDDMRMGASGAPDTLLTAIPARDVEIIENWNTLGMRGTGSHDANVSEVFVPEEYATPWVPLENPGRAYEGPLYRLTIWTAVASLAPAAIGIATAALHETLEVVSRKTPAYAIRALKDNPVVHRELAKADAEVASGRAYLYAVFDELFQKAAAGGFMSIEDKARAQLATTNAIQSSARAVSRLHEIVGAAGIREELPFQQHFRDVNVISQHGFVNAAKLESVGQIMIGRDPEWPFFLF